jgi:hypothetical protein
MKAAKPHPADDPFDTPGTEGTEAPAPLDGLLRQLAERADSARVRAWAARLLGGDAGAGGTSTPPPKLPPKRPRRVPVDYYSD